ncbi:MAG: response regulator [Methanohalobium sp.]|uniref:response regulator n=1 Tax=Methanohalobium sp. TaxID=2837493 RepID=UPI0039782E5E
MSNFSILLVEDDRLNRELINDLLSPYGYNIVNAGNGFEALDKIQNYDFDLILLDIQLPQMDGLELLSELKNNFVSINIPVVALTAHAMLGDKKKFINAGCDGYISKPVDVELFGNQVKEYLTNNKTVNVSQ